MIRKIIEIDQEKCNGCGICAQACHEGAIGMINGKAALLREDYCDGLGDCLPACPVGAITFVEREAAAYDEAAVKESKRQLSGQGQLSSKKELSDKEQPSGRSPASPVARYRSSWPPLTAPYFQGAHLLIAADCTAYAYADFHQDFIRGKITLIGCPKLDGWITQKKLAEIIKRNEISALTIVRMEVPCCGGIEHAAGHSSENEWKASSLAGGHHLHTGRDSRLTN